VRPSKEGEKTHANKIQKQDDLNNNSNSINTSGLPLRSERSKIHLQLIPLVF
jgi:hypothetical protein